MRISDSGTAWSRLPGVTIDGRAITIDPAQYFFRFGSSSWLVCDWDRVREELLDVTESTETALEQISLDVIRAHGRTTSDPAEVLSIAWQVYAYLFRNELLPVAGLEQIRPRRCHRRDARRGVPLHLVQRVPTHRVDQSARRSEFHPTSLHISERGWRLLDLARAFLGPGLLDLASWPGTVAMTRNQNAPSL